MSTVTKRRKLSTAPRSSPRTRGIEAFTKVSKGNNIAQKSIKDKISNIDTISITLSQPGKSVIGGKRKLAEIADEEIVEVQQNVPAVKATRSIRARPQKTSVKAQPIPQTPRKPILNSKINSVDTPTKGATGLLDRLFLTAKTPTRSPLNKSTKSHTPLLDLNTPPSSQELPTELIDLINLHAAFLTALSLHYAHNGTDSPADLRMLCPNIARAWGKRSVNLEDIRRILGVLNKQISQQNSDDRIANLTLSDYGHGKICIEITVSVVEGGRFAKPVNENLMNEVFMAGLKGLWKEAESMELNHFMDSLPMQAITICSSLVKGAAVLTKGQRRLEDFKVGVATMKEQEKFKAQEAEMSYKSGAKPTLLERLRAKQLQLANSPAPLTKEELARRVALLKIEEVAAVLSNLSTSSSVGQQRVSFTLPTIMSKLRDSLRTPISKTEGETCIRLLASEIAPAWVKLMKMGKGEALVVNRDERLTQDKLAEKVRQALN